MICDKDSKNWLESSGFPHIFIFFLVTFSQIELKRIFFSTITFNVQRAQDEKMKNVEKSFSSRLYEKFKYVFRILIASLQDVDRYVGNIKRLNS